MSRSLRKSELRTIMEEEGLLAGSDDDTKRTANIEQDDIFEGGCLTGDNGVGVGVIVDNSEVVFEDVDTELPSSPAISYNPQVTELAQLPSQFKKQAKQEVSTKNNHLTQWRIVEVTGLGTGALTTFGSYWFNSNMIFPISIYCGSAVFLAAISFGLLRMRKEAQKSATTFGRGILSGLNVAVHHLFFFLLPVGGYFGYQYFKNKK